jgi:hypothetical protein
VFQVVRETFNGQENVYVDGGLLCNYPIHAFDGKLHIYLDDHKPGTADNYKILKKGKNNPKY